MISVAHFKHLSIAKINIFISGPEVLDIMTKSSIFLRFSGLLYKLRFADTWRDVGDSFCKLTNLIELKYLHLPSNLMLNIFTFIGIVQA